MYRSVSSLFSLFLLLVPDLALTSDDGFYWKNLQIVMEKHQDWCLSSEGHNIKVRQCDSMDKLQRWSHDKKSRVIQEESGKCLTWKHNHYLILDDCTDDISFKWTQYLNRFESQARNARRCIDGPKAMGRDFVHLDYCGDNHHQYFITSDSKDSESVSERRRCASQISETIEASKGALRKEMDDAIKKIAKEKDQIIANLKKEKANELARLETLLSNMEKEKNQLETEKKQWVKEKNQLEVSLKDMKMKEAKLEQCVRAMRELKRNKF